MVQPNKYLDNMSTKKCLIPCDFYVIIRLPLQKWQWHKKKKGKKKIY